MSTVNTNEKKQSSKSRKKNALVHGVYADDIILPWESRREFDKLHADLRAEFRPVGRMEEESVLDLAVLRWRKRQMQRMWTAAHYRNQFVTELSESGKKSWPNILKHLREKAETTRPLAELSMAVIVEQIENTGELMAKRIKNEKMSKSEVKKGEQAGAIFDQFTKPVVNALEHQRSAEKSLSETYSPEHLEPIVRLEAMLDARIDKTIARLISLQEYKRYTANCSPLVPAALPSETIERRNQCERIPGMKQHRESKTANDFNGQSPEEAPEACSNSGQQAQWMPREKGETAGQ